MAQLFLCQQYYYKSCTFYKQKKGTKKRRVLNDSSDEEIFNKNPTKHTKEKLPKGKNKKEITPKLKEIKASDMFGNSPIKRTEPIVKKEKKKTTVEIGIHSDEEFEKSLLELDNTLPDVSISEMPKTDNTYLKVESNSSEKVKHFHVKEEKKPTPDELNEPENYHNKKINKHVATKEKTPKKKIANEIFVEQSKTPKELKEHIKNENKRPFTMFIDDCPKVENDLEAESQNKKRKLDKSLNESGLF